MTKVLYCARTYERDFEPRFPLFRKVLFVSDISLFMTGGDRSHDLWPTPDAEEKVLPLPHLKIFSMPTHF